MQPVMTLHDDFTGGYDDDHCANVKLDIDGVEDEAAHVPMLPPKPQPQVG